MNSIRIVFCVCVLLIANTCCLPVVAVAADNDSKTIVYRLVGDTELKLDLFLPDEPAVAAPCVVFIHGGGWLNGNRGSGKKNAAWLTQHGFAVASIDYRLTDVAQWPAQIDDCYSAVAWVREHGGDFGIDPKRIGVFGTSAGAHLAALVGTRRNPKVGGVSTKVQAVCDFFGPADLLSMPPNNVGNGRTAEQVAKSNGAKLLGATVRDVPKLARDASALCQVSRDDAPFLIVHGSEDPGVPLAQSQRLHAALVHEGVPSRLHVLAGAKHGGKEFKTEQVQAVVADFFSRNLKRVWNQGAGGQGDFRRRDLSSPTDWSVVRDENIRWRKRLPETGQSTVAVWENRVFFSTMEKVDADAQLGSNIVAWCCDADTGETNWKRDVPADHPLRLSGCFSDSTGPPPVTDGKHVVFFNASGAIVCFDFDGDVIWQKELMAVGRSQPVLLDGQVVFIKQTYMPDDGGHFTHDHKDAPLDQWTQLQAVDIKTGDPTWHTTCGVNMGCVPLPMTLSDGRRVMVVGRGGGHSPPEKPEGISMIDLVDGSTLWTLELPRFMSTMTFPVFRDEVLVFDRDEHLWIDAFTGKITRRVNYLADVVVHARKQGKDIAGTQSLKLGKKTRALIQQSNLLVGKYHFFRSYTQPWLGRVNVESGDVEYLQLPVQVEVTETNRRELWSDEGMSPKLIESLKNAARKRPSRLPVQQWCFRPNEMKNSRGHVVMGDARSMGNGWGHHASQVPTVVGKHLYVPTMSGIVYVIDWNADRLDRNAVIAINDLGELGQSWCRASLSAVDGRLYAHTIADLICIEAE